MIDHNAPQCQGKTAAQEADDCVTMLGIVMIAATVVLCLGVLLCL